MIFTLNLGIMDSRTYSFDRSSISMSVIEISVIYEVSDYLVIFLLLEVGKIFYRHYLLLVRANYCKIDTFYLCHFLDGATVYRM